MDGKHQKAAEGDLLDIYPDGISKPPCLVEIITMSLSDLFGHKKPIHRKSRDVRRNEVETAVRRLNNCAARTHEISAELKESYRDATESSKQVLECLCCPRLEPSRLDREEFEDLP